MYRFLLLTITLLVPLGLLAQNASIHVDYDVPDTVEFEDDFEIEVTVTNDGASDIDSDIFFHFNVDTDYPSSFPPSTTFQIELDNDDEIEPGEEIDDELEVDTDKPSNNFTNQKQNIITIWPRVDGNGGLDSVEYFIGEIEVVDNNSSPTGIKITEIPQITVFPSPAATVASLSLPVAHQGETLNVFSTFGQHIESRTIVGEENIDLDLTGLASGVYIINIRDKDNKVIFWGRFSKIETK